MNKVLSGITALSSLFLLACDGATFASFTADEELPATTVEGGGLAAILPTAFTPFSLDVKNSAAFNSNDYDYLNSIKLTDITLAVLPESEDTRSDANENGIPDDFSFIDTLSLYIRADINGMDSRQLIAELPENWNEIRDGLQQFSMTMQSVNILDYVEAPNGYTIESEASGTAPADNVIFGGSAEYNVKVGFR